MQRSWQLLLLICFCSVPLHAQMGLPTSGIRFFVKPKLCVLAEGENECHDKLELIWSADTLKSVCLFQRRKNLPLRCWEDERKGRHIVEIRTGEDIEFQLREVDDQSLVIAKSFEVVQDKPQFRRRRRNPWSFF